METKSRSVFGAGGSGSPYGTPFGVALHALAGRLAALWRRFDGDQSRGRAKPDLQCEVGVWRRGIRIPLRDPLGEALHALAGLLAALWRRFDGDQSRGRAKPDLQCDVSVSF